ncbi:hypothetical protein F5Y17DRAFT_431718 [Xylariaceae sp. FL0594]|nr:hypothetical protein F5Y17DRAFT_431718 [Xylariaceae sp. FL0594]
MRPLHTDDTLVGRHRGRSARLDDQDSHHGARLAPNYNLSFCVADEATVDSYLEQPAHSTPFPDRRKTAEPPRKEDNDHARDGLRSYSPFSRPSPFSGSSTSLVSQFQPPTSRPLTPIMPETSCIGSGGSETSSRRHSITSSISELGTNRDQEQGEEQLSGHLASTTLGGDSVPELIMPSIKMPSRRPFTETGKSFGRLKILLAGPSGAGKTSLLKAIVQTCDHIIHVDPISLSREMGPSVSRSAASAGPSRRTLPSTTAIAEVYASTKPYPEWWQELEAPRTSHRRKSLGDRILERNICFVDTPGYGTALSAMEAIVPCVDYVESHFNKILSDELCDADLMNMLGGGGGCQVDVVLYLISQSLKPVDLEYIRRLVLFTNVIPVLTHADLSSQAEMAARKQEILAELRRAGIRPFTFTPTVAQGPDAHPTPSIPYTVSSASVSEHEIMDASLLMSPDYVQPLMSTELAFLVERMFSLDGASWLRHSAAKKYLQWREQTPRGANLLQNPLVFPEPSNVCVPARTSQALARVPRQRHTADNASARLQMADWAADLQRSRAAERRQYEALLRGERAVWLTEKLHECIQDGTLVAARSGSEANSAGEKSKRSQRSLLRSRSGKTRHQQDPLGLLQVAADLKAKGWMALEVVGTLGVASLLVWISQHTWSGEMVEWRAILKF